MKSIFLLFSIVSIVLIAGCVSTGPQTGSSTQNAESEQGGVVPETQTNISSGAVQSGSTPVTLDTLCGNAQYCRDMREKCAKAIENNCVSISPAGYIATCSGSFDLDDPCWRYRCSHCEEYLATAIQLPLHLATEGCATEGACTGTDFWQWAIDRGIWNPEEEACKSNCNPLGPYSEWQACIGACER